MWTREESRGGRRKEQWGMKRRRREKETRGRGGGERDKKWEGVKVGRKKWEEKWRRIGEE